MLYVIKHSSFMKSWTLKNILLMHIYIGVSFAVISLILRKMELLAGMSSFADLNVVFRWLIQGLGLITTVLNPVSVFLSNHFYEGKEFGFSSVYYLVFILSVPLNSFSYTFVFYCINYLKNIILTKFQPR